MDLCTCCKEQGHFRSRLFFCVAPFSLSCLRIFLTTVPVMIMKQHLSVMILLCGHKNLSSNLCHGACWGSAGADAWTAEAGAAPGPDAAQPAGNTGKSNQMSTNVFFVFIVFFELCLILYILIMVVEATKRSDFHVDDWAWH